MAAVALGIGIVSLFVGWFTCGLLPALAGALGHQAHRDIRRYGRSGRRIAIAAWVIGDVTLVPSILLTAWLGGAFR